MRSPFVVLSAALVLCPPAAAQERTPNPGVQPIVRAWPKSGAWEVGLARLAGGGLGCLLATAHVNQGSGERYFWGIRQRGQDIAAMIVDNNEAAIAGRSIQIIVDQIPIGSYTITRRSAGAGIVLASADLPARDGNRLLSLIKVGGVMQFVTSTATYSAALQGTQQALLNLEACTVEAEHLNAASNVPAAPPQGR
jgi:hypothetical protein